jgi:hypothetical protein
MRTPARTAFASLLLAAALGCSHDPTGPGLSLVGTWQVVGFVSVGLAAEVDGTAVFTDYGLYTFDTQIRFPGEAGYHGVASGRWELDAPDRVTLRNSRGGIIRYQLARDHDRLVLTSFDSPQPVTITLRSTSR